MGLSPIDFNLLCNQTGEGAIAISLIINPKYLGHLSGSFTTTENESADFLIFNFSTRGIDHLKGIPLN